MFFFCFPKVLKFTSRGKFLLLGAETSIVCWNYVHYIYLVVLYIVWRGLQNILGSRHIEEHDLWRYIEHLVHTIQDKDLYISYFYMLIDMNILHYLNIQVCSMAVTQQNQVNKNKMAIVLLLGIVNRVHMEKARMGFLWA